MEKHSSLSSAVWSLLSVQTWTLGKVRSCSNSSKEFCFPHTVLRKVFVEMREVHLIKKQKQKPQEPNQQQQNSPFPLLWCGNSSVQAQEGPITCLWFSCLRVNDLDLTNFLIPEPSSSPERCCFSGRAAFSCAGKSCHFGWCKVFEMNTKLGRTFAAFQLLTMQQNWCYLSV